MKTENRKRFLTDERVYQELSKHGGQHDRHDAGGVRQNDAGPRSRPRQRASERRESVMAKISGTLLAADIQGLRTLEAVDA
jgi:hypothetical protein